MNLNLFLGAVEDGRSASKREAPKRQRRTGGAADRSRATARQGRPRPGRSVGGEAPCAALRGPRTRRSPTGDFCGSKNEHADLSRCEAPSTGAAQRRRTPRVPKAPAGGPGIAGGERQVKICRPGVQPAPVLGSGP